MKKDLITTLLLTLSAVVSNAMLKEKIYYLSYAYGH